MSNANSGPNHSVEPGADVGGSPVVAETQVKQGRKGTHTFVILITSLALAVILVFGLWAFKSGDLKSADHTDNGSKAAAAGAFNTGPSQPKAGTTESKSPT